ncbi:dihydrodipicolinate synthase family protein [Phragmitibacter flavus]|uniref:Dihydrodipicolinate synthase family protein n=1 Tax=Phragmitibacter flavus TaxID=2576071 RepID=A0A5R8KCR6_9BACT|nr:dihydrodipicolinate synthase family protein [Phragmitibacter flavus]TLD70091.1 dihydrodipicolinate synthase family protein [Phragmitibacter flavus]
MQTSLLKGIVPPVITPLKSRDELDVGGLEKVIEHLLSGGVHGVFALGTTGEFASLSEEMKRDVVTHVCREIKGRVTVLVGITHTSPADSLKLARYAADQGAHALVLSTPYYFALSQVELLEYFEKMVPQLPLPVYLYNIPACTKVSIEIDTARRALELPNVVGFKDSSGNMGYFQQLLQLQNESNAWSLLMGPEELVGEAVLMGAQGGVCGGANLFPRLFVNLYEAAERGDVAEVKRLQQVVMNLASTLYRTGSYGSSFVKSLKCAMSLLGLCEDAMAGPFEKFDGEHRQRVAKVLDELDINLIRATSGPV